nr:IPT/TIG domain-containing protein [uncultured Flavobacterium sp.]
MKTNKFRILFAVLAIMSLTVLFSCDDDNNSAGGTPTIESVSLAKNDSLVEFGFADNMYIIRGNNFSGTKKIYFNDLDTYFNATLVTNNTILVTINRNTPYENVSSELKVVTPGGEAVYSFRVLPPAPAITSFNPINAAEGEQFTIYGSYFLEPSVSVGGVNATVVSSTLTQIVAVMPAGSNRKFVKVTTDSGSNIWNVSPVGTAIYDDAFYSPWTIDPSSNHEFVTNPADAFQGTTFFKKSIPGWDNIGMNWVWDERSAQATGIHFAVKSDAAGKLEVIFNGDWSTITTRQFTTTTNWTDVRLTWADLGLSGAPAALQNITFKESSGATHVYSFDNIGFTID